jgi:hypothetical protein
VEPEIELLNLQKEYRKKDEIGMPMSIRERYRSRLEKLKEKVRNKAQKKKLGQLLVDEGAISSEQLEWALAEQDDLRDDKLLGEILIDNGFLEWKELREGLEKQVRVNLAEEEKTKRAA